MRKAQAERAAAEAHSKAAAEAARQAATQAELERQHAENLRQAAEARSKAEAEQRAKAEVEAQQIALDRQDRNVRTQSVKPSSGMITCCRIGSSCAKQVWQQRLRDAETD